MLALREEPRARQQGVLAAVVEVQMAVHDDVDVREAQAAARESGREPVFRDHDRTQRARGGSAAPGDVGVVDVVGVETRVEEHDELVGAHEPAPDRRAEPPAAARAEGRRVELHGAETQQLKAQRSHYN